ncbi:MAG: NAD-dependent epimerase/dehydratase family protein [bacterium]|nr:NAD-dependent epimerase/dehydratase family protein [bacterium]
MRVLVTGGAGFIGSHLVRSCLEAGDDVRVLDDLSSGHLANLDGVLDAVDYSKGSVVDPDQVAHAVADCEVVFHQAAVASVPQSLDDPIGTHAVNATGTLNVLEAARRAGVRRVVFAASCAVYGDSEELPKTEAMPARPLSPYALHKHMGERYCELYSDLLGLEAVALRYFNVFGPRQDPKSMYAGVIPIFVTALVGGRTPRVDGDGLQTRDFVYVQDVVAANRAAAVAPSVAAGKVINVGRGESVTILELLREIALALGVDPPAPDFAPARPGDVSASRADIHRARELLDWQPGVDLRTGLRDTVAYYRDVRR